MIVLTALLAVLTAGGVVVDVSTQMPVAGALVILPEHNETTLTGEDGRFSLRVETGRHYLVIMAEGYETLRLVDVEITPQTGDLRIPLTPLSSETAGSSLEYRMEEIAVTASRMAARVAEIPREVRVIDAPVIQRMMPAGAPDILREAPEVLVQQTSLGGGSPIMRGLSGNRVLLLVDGVRLNNSTYRVGLNQYLNTIAVGLIDRVEVVPGAGSALYGSDALGGVINVLSVDPAPGRPRLTYSGRLTAAEGSSCHSIRLTKPWNGGGLSAGAGYRDLNDLRGGGRTGIQKPTGYTEWSADTKLIFPLSRESSLTCSYQTTRQHEVPRTDRVAAGEDLLNVYDPQDRELFFLRCERHAPGSGIRFARLTASWNHQREGRRIVRSNEPDTMQDFRDDVQTFGVSGEVQPSLGDPLSLVCGADVYYDAVDSEGEYVSLATGARRRVEGKFPDDGESLSTGLFAQAEAPLTSRFSLTGALRLSSFHLQGTPRGPWGKTELDNWVATGSLRGGYRPVPDGLVFFGISQAFRAPNMEDALSAGLSNKGYDVPNPELTPERSVSCEAGFRCAVATTTTAAGSRPDTKHSHLIHTAFYLTLVEDLIERAPTTFLGSDSLDGAPVFHQENQGRALISGFSAAGRFHLGSGWSLRVALAYTFGKNRDRNHPLTRIPPLRGNLALRCARGRTWTEVLVDWSLWQDRLSPDDLRDTRIPPGGTPGYFVAGLGGGIDIDDSWSIRLMLENLFDRAYRIHGSGIDMPGRNLILGIEGKYW